MNAPDDAVTGPVPVGVRWRVRSAVLYAAFATGGLAFAGLILATIIPVPLAQAVLAGAGAGLAIALVGMALTARPRVHVAADGSMLRSRYGELRPHEVTEVALRVASGGAANTVQLRLRAPTRHVVVSLWAVGREPIDAEGAAALDRFLAGVPRQDEPADADPHLTAEQRAMADWAHAVNRWRTVSPGSARVVAREVASGATAPREPAPDADPGVATAQGTPAGPHTPHGPDEPDQRTQWERDDASAREHLRAHPPSRMPRMLNLAFLVVTACAVGLGAAALRNDQAQPWTALALSSLVLAVLLLLAETVASDLAARSARRSALAWLASRDDDQLRRGLPPELLTGWARPGTRSLYGAEMACWVAGGLAFLGGSAYTLVEARTAPAWIVGLVLAGGGAALIAVAIWLNRWRRRHHRRTIDDAARYAGVRAGRPAR